MLHDLRFVLLGLFVSLTGCAYEAGALLAPPTSPAQASSATECVDVQATLIADEHMPVSSAVVVYRFGNRCRSGVDVDFTAVTVTGHSVDGTASVLRLHDPLHDVARARLDALGQGEEALRYDGPSGEVALERVCVDVSRITTTHTRPAPICLAAPGVANHVTRATPGLIRAHESSCAGHGCGEQRPGGQPFGSAWDVDGLWRVRLDLGLSAHSIQTKGLTLSQSTVGDVPASVLGSRLSAGTFDLRSTVHFAGLLYTGLELDVGLGGTPARSLGGETRTLASSPSAHVLSGALLGAQTPIAGPLQLRGEVFVGGRLVSVPLHRGDSGGAPARLLGVRWAVQPRAALDLWVAPNVSLGVWAGADVIHRGDWSGGLTFVLHSRALDAE